MPPASHHSRGLPPGSLPSCTSSARQTVRHPRPAHGLPGRGIEAVVVVEPASDDEEDRRRRYREHHEHVPAYRGHPVIVAAGPERDQGGSGEPPDQGPARRSTASRRNTTASTTESGTSVARSRLPEVALVQLRPRSPSTNANPGASMPSSRLRAELGPGQPTERRSRVTTSRVAPPPSSTASRSAGAIWRSTTTDSVVLNPVADGGSRDRRRPGAVRPAHALLRLWRLTIKRFMMDIMAQSPALLNLDDTGLLIALANTGHGTAEDSTAPGRTCKAHRPPRTGSGARSANASRRLRDGRRRGAAACCQGPRARGGTAHQRRGCRPRRRRLSRPPARRYRGSGPHAQPGGRTARRPELWPRAPHSRTDPVAGRRQPPATEGLPRTGVRVGVPRRHPQRSPTLVRHGGLRQSSTPKPRRSGPAAGSPTARRSRDDVGTGATGTGAGRRARSRGVPARLARQPGRRTRP